MGLNRRIIFSGESLSPKQPLFPPFIFLEGNQRPGDRVASLDQFWTIAASKNLVYPSSNRPKLATLNGSNNNIHSLPRGGRKNVFSISIWSLHACKEGAKERRQEKEDACQRKKVEIAFSPPAAAHSSCQAAVIYIRRQSQRGE